MFRLLHALTVVAAALAADEQMYKKMAYTFVRDPGAPLFVSKHYPLFSKLGPDDVTTGSHATGKVTKETSEYEHDQAKKVQSDLGLSSSYGAFKATVHASFNSVHSTTTHTMKSVRSFIFDKYHATVEPDSLWEYIPEEHQNTLLTAEPQKVHQRYGEFYVPSYARFGGVFKSMFSREMSESEDSSKVATDMEAGYFSTGVKANLGVQQKTDDFAMHTFFSMEAFGGNPLTLAGSGDVSSLQEKWAASIEDDTLFLTSLGLSPIWEVLPAEHGERAKQLQTYFTELWKQEDDLVPTATGWAKRDCDHTKEHAYWCDDYSRRRRRNRSGWGMRASEYCPDGCRFNGSPIFKEWCNDHGGFYVCRNHLAAGADVANASSATDLGGEEAPPEQSGLGGSSALAASAINV